MECTELYYICLAAAPPPQGVWGPPPVDGHAGCPPPCGGHGGFPPPPCGRPGPALKQPKTPDIVTMFILQLYNEHFITSIQLLYIHIYPKSFL